METLMSVAIVLASASPRRKELLERIGFTVKSVPANVDENPMEGEAPDNYVKRLARAKTLATVDRMQQTLYPKEHLVTSQLDESVRWVLGADTAVVLEDLILGKPKDPEDEGFMLESLSGRVHTVMTGFCLYDMYKNKEGLQAVTTLVKMKKLTPNELERYVASGEGLDKAGGYAIQGVGAYIIDSINGSYTNVVGLPLAQVVEMMQEMGAEELLPF